MSLKQAKHIFFDLDHTIWDFEKNSNSTLTEIIKDFNSRFNFSIDIDDFLEVYKPHNEMLWEKYRNEEISKEFLRINRFSHALSYFGVDDTDIHELMAQTYVEESPKKTGLFPNAIEALQYLFSKYQLHIITNGFNEVQFTKIKSSNIDKYFQHIITSENVGFKKPDCRIFDYALERVNAKPEQCVMIGDNYQADIEGALKLNIPAVFFNPYSDPYTKNQLVYEINDLIELKNIL